MNQKKGRWFWRIHFNSTRHDFEDSTSIFYYRAEAEYDLHERLKNIKHYEKTEIINENARW
jgi:hypothetical protein